MQSLLRNVGGADIYVSDATGGGQSSGGLSGMGSFMSLLGIGDNQERIVIKGSDYEMMQVVAEDVRYQVEQQDYIQSARVSFTRRQPEVLLGFEQLLLTSYGITRANITTGLSEMNTEFSSALLLR